LLGLLLAPLSCVPPVRDVDAPLTLPTAFSKSGTVPLPEKWWTALGDAQLNALIDQALKGNFGLRSAWDRLDQAWAIAAQRGAARSPTLDGSADVSRTAQKTRAAPTTHATGYSLGLVAAYEVDLWGRVRATEDAAKLDALATAEDLSAAAMTLTAEVADTWYQLVEQRGQLALLDAQMKINRDYLEVITLKFRRGQASATDVLQQRQLVESIRGERTLAASAAEVLGHQLAALLGRAPRSITLTTPKALPPLPALPRTGVPAAWIRRRPDVRAAELRVQAADRDLAAAIADRFPRLTLSATAQTSSRIFTDLFDTWLAGIAAGLDAPLLDGGRRRAQVEENRAALSGRLNAYGDTVVDSLREVEDALTQEARQGEYVASLQGQLALSKQATDQTRDSYTKGTMEFTRYLTTLLEHQRLERTALQARRTLVQYRINLYRALAGGWTPARPEGPPAPGRPDKPSTRERP